MSRLSLRKRAVPDNAVVVLLTPRGTSVTLLPAGIDIRRQMVLKGVRPEVITIGLRREGETVWVESVLLDVPRQR